MLARSRGREVGGLGHLALRMCRSECLSACTIVQEKRLNIL